MSSPSLGQGSCPDDVNTPTSPYPTSTKPTNNEKLESSAPPARAPTPVNEFPPKDFSPSHQFLSRSDPLNPVTSRGTRQKIGFLLCLSLPACAVTFASTIYAPLIERLSDEYGVSRIVYQLNITLSVLGFGLAPVLFSPLSEVVGRKPVLVGGSLLFTAFNIGIIFAPDIASFVTFRFLAFLFGGPAVTLCIATLTDVTTYEERHFYYSIAGTFLFSGAALGPLIGGIIEGTAVGRAKDWSRWLVPIVSFLAILPYAFFCTESYAPVLVRQRLQARDQRGGANPTSSAFTLVDSRSPLPLSQLSQRSDRRREWRERGKDLRQRYIRALALPCVFATQELLIISVTAYVSLVYFFIYCTLEAFPYTFGMQRGWSTTEVGLTYISLLIGFILSTIFPLCTTQQRYIARTVGRLQAGEKMRPEARLSDMLWCAFIAPAGLFLFAWTAPYPHIHCIAPLLGMVLFSFAVNVAFTDFLPYLADVYGPYAASALSVPAVSRCLFASASPLISRIMFDRITVQGSLSILAGGLLVLAAVPYLFWYKGHVIRRKSKYAAKS